MSFPRVLSLPDIFFSKAGASGAETTAAGSLRAGAGSLFYLLLFANAFDEAAVGLAVEQVDEAQIGVQTSSSWEHRRLKPPFSFSFKLGWLLHQASLGCGWPINVQAFHSVGHRALAHQIIDECL